MFTNKLLLCVIAIMLSFGGVHALNDMPLLAELSGEHPQSCFGYSVVSLDFNHDGYDDLIVYSMAYGHQNSQSPSRGKVYIYYGGPNFSSASEPAMTLEGDYPNGTQRRIRYIRNIGDVSGDGYDDLLISDAIPGPSGLYVEGSERYMLYFGGTNDLSTPDRIEIPQMNEVIYKIDMLKDVDGDGYDDVGISYAINYLHCHDILWGGSFQRQMILCGGGGFHDIMAITGIGDINNDGFDDFSIGYLDAQKADDQYSTIRVYYGNISREFSEFNLLIHTPNYITRVCKPLGDLNNDGFDDFLGYIDSSGMKIWLGSNNPLTLEPDVVLNPIYYGDILVNGVKSGDFNGDGFSDVVGASYYLRRYAVWLGSTSMNGFVDYQKYSSIEQFGWDVAVGDFNGDGCDDIAVSAPSNDWPASSFTGYVFVYAGNPGMVANDDQFAPPLTEGINMLISPNPVRRDGVLRLSLRGADKYVGMPVKVEVFNIKGQAVQQTETPQSYTHDYSAELNLSGLASGVYLCRATIGKQAVNKKVTIIK